MERCCHARCAGVPSTRSRQQHERRRAADLDIRTLHGRQAPPPGRQPTTRRQSRSHSGPLRALNPPVHLSVPPRKSEKCPSTPFPSAAGSARSATPASCLDAIEGPACGRRVAAPRRLPQLPAGPPVTRQQRQHEHRSAADLGIRGRQAPPPGRQPKRPHSGPLRAFQTRRCTSGHPREIRKVPVNAVSQRRWLRPVRHAGTRTLNINPIPALRRRRGTLKRITASLTQIGQTLGWLSWHPSTCAISRPSPAPLQAAVCHPRSFDPRGGPRSSRTRHGRRNRGRSAHGPQPGAPSVGAAHLPPDH